MNGKPTVRPWVKMPLDLIESDAWRSLGINDRRLIDFLMVEHMRHGGKENGELKAPRRQLVSSGIGEHFVSAAIRNAERLGLVDAHRHGKRVATTYALTWLPFHDGTPASNRWRDYRAPEPTIKRLKRRLVLVSEKIPDGLNLAAKQQSDANEKLAAKQHSDVPAKQHADGLNLAAKQQSDANEKLAAKQHSLSRTRSYHLGAIDKTEVERSAVSAPYRSLILVSPTSLPNCVPATLPTRSGSASAAGQSTLAKIPVSNTPRASDAVKYKTPLRLR